MKISFQVKNFLSAPDDSEVPKDPQMTYQTRSASSHAETQAAMSPEPTEAPFIPKVEQSSSTARPSATQPSTIPQSSTSQPSTIPPTASPSCMELSPEPMSQSRAMKRPLEQTHHHVRCGTHGRTGIQTRRQREDQCLPLVHRMKWLKLLLPCHIAKQSRLPKNLQQPWQLWRDKDEEKFDSASASWRAFPVFLMKASKREVHFRMLSPGCRLMSRNPINCRKRRTAS